MKIAKASFVLMAVSLAFAQEFEVASVKLSRPPEGDLININLGTFRNGRLTMTNVTLNDAIKVAYDLPSDDLLVGPEWNRSVRFDIEAKMPAGAAPDQLHAMLRTLLAERLHLVVRREERVVRYLGLVTGKKGAKLSPAKEDASPNAEPQVRGRIAHNHLTMGGLASLLSRFERQTVVDQTGIPGAFDIHLEWAPDSMPGRDDLTAPPPDRPGLFAAVQDELGLRLESRRGPLPVLIVEQAAKVPDEN